jgi:hypothetical protein
VRIKQSRLQIVDRGGIRRHSYDAVYCNGENITVENTSRRSGVTWVNFRFSARLEPASRAALPP